MILIACEIWNAVGGLGRVCIYRAINMVRLLGENVCERHYPRAALRPIRLTKSILPQENLVPLDYSLLPISVNQMEKVDQFNVQVNGENVPASVSKGTNKYGIHVRLIGDLWRVFTRAVYRHDHEFGAKSKRDFMSFYRQAVMMDILKEQRKKYERAQREGLPLYASGALSGRRSTGPLVEYKRYMDRVVEGASVLWYCVTFFFTHTVINREWFAVDGDPGDPTRDGDATSKGIETADAVAAVSAHHLDITAAPKKIPQSADCGSDQRCLR